ncbi:MAG: cyclically-permuted mutarotase family protein [Bacteroidales bacterium]|nr:cyclically-permuted mutarotase family protein [Bacteroidales bacterium]
MKIVKILVIALLVILLGYLIFNKKTTKHSSFSVRTIPTVENDSLGFSKGVSGAFAGISNDMLIFAGGCNFPDIPVSEGGSKVYYSSVYGLEAPYENSSEWKKLGDLPFPLGYGVSVNHNNTLYIIGGVNSDSSKADAFKVTYSDGELNIEPFESLPVRMDNMAGCVVKDKIYVMGGNVDGEPSNRVFSFDLNHDQSHWKEIEPFPGDARVQPLCVGGKNKFILLGGFFPGNIDLHKHPSLFPTPLVFNCNKNRWDKAKVPAFNDQFSVDIYGEEVTNPFAFVGAFGATFEGNRAVCMGGVNDKVFLNALEREYVLKDAGIDSLNFKRLNEEKQEYLKQDEDYYNFNRFLITYDFDKDEWNLTTSSPDLKRAGASLVKVDDNGFILLNGELKPGVRSNINVRLDLFADF